MSLENGKLDAALPYADKAAMGLSFFCVLHCLALPLIAATLPSLIATGLRDEAFHIWMIMAVLPISLYALTMGCRNHRRYTIMVVGACGLLVLCTPLFLGHAVLGESGEKTLTVFGAVLVAASHILNYRLCRQKSDCECPE